MFTEICTISKEFCKALKKEEIAECRGKRGPQRKLQLEELITLNYIRFAFHIKDMKGIYNLAKELKIVKELPSYANFIKGSNRIVPIISKFLNYLLMKKLDIETIYKYILLPNVLFVLSVLFNYIIKNINSRTRSPHQKNLSNISD